jgi:hypothetical protein
MPNFARPRRYLVDHPRKRNSARARETGFAPDCVVADAVLIGPVSKSKFPDNREINREFFNFGPFSAILAPNRQANSIACSKIPYAMEQGIFLTEQGIIFAEQGILAPEQGIGPRTNFLTMGAAESGTGLWPCHTLLAGGRARPR